jgi:membrane-anchored glycerophosphoryl diester phosphodiesterase (GDPDase)
MPKIDIGQIIGDSFSTLVNNRTVLAIAVIAAVLNAFFYFLINPAAITVASASLVSILIIVIVWLLVDVFLSGAAIAAVSSKVDLGAAFSKSASRYLALLGTSILTGIIVILGFIALIIPGIYLAIRLAVATPSVIIEGKAPVDAVKRSWAITKGNWWPIFGVIFVIGIVVEIVQLIFGIPSRVLGTGVAGFLEYVSVIASVLILLQLKGSAKAATPPASKRKASNK